MFLGDDHPVYRLFILGVLLVLLGGAGFVADLGYHSRQFQGHMVIFGINIPGSTAVFGEGQFLWRFGIAAPFLSVYSGIMIVNNFVVNHGTAVLWDFVDLSSIVHFTDGSQDYSPRVLNERVLASCGVGILLFSFLVLPDHYCLPRLDHV
jgi:hypothetical protein